MDVLALAIIWCAVFNKTTARICAESVFLYREKLTELELKNDQ